MSDTDGRPVAAQDAYASWQELARSSQTVAMLDVVRNVIAASRPWPLLVRALAVLPVYVRPDQDGRVATSRSGDEEFLHAYSSPVRLTAALDRADRELTIQEVFVADLVDGAAGPLGVRIDPGLETEVIVPPAMAQEVLAVASGLPVPAALTPAEGEELRVEAGPEQLTDLDRRIRDAVHDHAPGARIVRAAATLAGLGGRLWPVYSISSAAQSPMSVSGVAQRAAGVPLVLVVDGRPEQLAELLAIDAHGVDVTALRE